MIKSSSLDLRQRVARFVEAGHSCHTAGPPLRVRISRIVSAHFVGS
ncbi:hypothetical protein ACD578_30640 (plasmid) [Microvirga sp. RSM25]